MFFFQSRPSQYCGDIQHFFFTFFWGNGPCPGTWQQRGKKIRNNFSMTYGSWFQNILQEQKIAPEILRILNIIILKKWIFISKSLIKLSINYGPQPIVKKHTCEYLYVPTDLLGSLSHLLCIFPELYDMKKRAGCMKGLLRRHSPVLSKNTY